MKRYLAFSLTFMALVGAYGALDTIYSLATSKAGAVDCEQNR